MGNFFGQTEIAFKFPNMNFGEFRELVCVTVQASANQTEEMTFSNGAGRLSVWFGDNPDKKNILNDAKQSCPSLQRYLDAMELGSIQELTFTFRGGGVLGEFRPPVRMNVVKANLGALPLA
jgi:hypothetical protein